MANSPQSVIAGTARRLRLAVLVGSLLCVLTSGCVLTKPFCGEPEQKPGCAPVLAVITTWQKQLYYTEDIRNNGQQMPGLRGRFYLFGTDQSHPIEGDGTLHVEAYDDRPLASGGQPVWLGEWNLDKEAVHKLLSNDKFVGWGYSIFLPWPRTDVNHIHLLVRYTQANGTPVYATSESMVLNRDNIVQSAARNTTTIIPPPGMAPPPGMMPPQGMVPPQGMIVPQGTAPPQGMASPPGNTVPQTMVVPPQPTAQVPGQRFVVPQPGAPR